MQPQNLDGGDMKDFVLPKNSSDNSDPLQRTSPSPLGGSPNEKAPKKADAQSSSQSLSEEDSVGALKLRVEAAERG